MKNRKVYSSIGVGGDSNKKVQDDTHDKIIELIRQESVNVDEMVKHMKDLEAQTSVEIQSDSPKLSDSESQPGNYKFSKENLLYSRQHTLGFLAQNFFHSTIIPPWRVSWVSREVEKLKELKFVCFVCCFSAKMEWHSKSIQKLSNSSEMLLFFRIFSESVQIWLKNSNPNK